MIEAVSAPLTERPSGIIVPAHLANAPEGAPAEPSHAVDPDGRRRVVLDRQTRRALSVVARNFGSRDVATLFHCMTSKFVTKTIKDAATGEDVEAIVREPIDGACGQIMEREGDGTIDPGFGCKCTRVHFIASGA